jgi:hypothetical protein
MAEGVVDKLAGVEKSVDSVTAAFAKLQKSALDGSGGGLNDTILSMEGIADASDKATLGMIDLVKALPNGAAIAAPFEMLQAAMKATADIAIVGIKSFNNLGKSQDAITSMSRGLNASMYDLASNFAGSYDEAKKFSIYLEKSSLGLYDAAGGVLQLSDSIKAAEALSGAGIPLQKMGEAIQFAGGELNMFSLAVLHSQSLGMELSSYAQKISDAMMNQGLSSQQAVEQMTMFGEISKAIGLPVESVASNLSGMADKFSLLGIKASFGAPILEGFTKTLNGLGLGTKNALELTSTFSDALVKLTSDYAAAYVTFQRGGLDIGSGGGVLGASIGLRAKSIDAEKNGTQGDLAMDLANSMKETLQSFTGGQVITVTEAAASPELQATFYTQTQLLKDLYGIQDTGAQDRTLELLQQLDDATRSGDTDLMASTAAQLDEAKTGRADTKSYEDRVAALAADTLAQIDLSHKDAIAAAKQNADLLSVVAGAINKSYLNTVADLTTAGSTALNSQLMDPSSAIKQITTMFDTTLASNKIASEAGKVVDAAGGVNTVDKAIDKAKEVSDNGMAALTSQISQLVAQISMLLSKGTKSSTTGN